MAMRPQLGLLLLVAGVLVCAQLQQTAAMPMHPDLLSFIKLPAASDPSEQLQQTAARKLQQDPLFDEGGGPFTFDGFGFGFGGLFPAGGFFDGFGVNVYNILIRDLFNRDLQEGLGTALPNNLDPFNYVPPTIGNLFNRDVAVLFGYDAVDKYIGQYLSRATASVGEVVDAGCVGPTYSVTVNGGECEINDDGSVECEEPFVELSETPFICNLPYREAAELEGQSFKYKAEFGREREGELGLAAGEYNFGAAVNVTTPYLGVSLATRILADDFGLQQWYQYVGALVLNELIRIQAALLSGAVDERIINAPQGRAGAAAGGPIAAGVASVADASGVLLDRIAQQMGISVRDLSAGLDSVGLMPKQQQLAAADGKAATAGEPPVRKAEGAPKPEVRPAPKPEPKAAPKPESKAAPKADPKAAPKAEPKAAPKAEAKVAPKPTARAAPKPAAKAAPKPAPKAAPKPAAKKASEPKH